MMTSQKISTSSLLIFCFVSILASAQAADVPGSKDHPVLARNPGSVIVEYSAKEFDEFLLPLGKLNSDGKFTKSQRLEGKVTRIRYQFPKNRSVLEVSRNYETRFRAPVSRRCSLVSTKNTGRGTFI